MQDLRNCHKTLVGAVHSLSYYFVKNYSISVQAPYEKNMPVAAIPNMVHKPLEIFKYYAQLPYRYGNVAIIAIILSCYRKVGIIIAAYMVPLLMLKSAMVKSGFITTALKIVLQTNSLPIR